MPRLLAPERVDFPRVPYGKWRSSMRWRQGEHVVLVGPTGCGKTTVMRDLLAERAHTVLFASKVRDKSLDRYVRDGYTRIGKYADSPYNKTRFILWPQHSGPIRELVGVQSQAFRGALDDMFREGGWTVGIDELHYVCSSLGLQPEMEMYFHQGRSSNLTIVAGMQRPAWVPVVAFSSATHALIWKTTEQADLKRLSGLSRTDIKDIAYNMSKLGEHDFIAINTRSEGARPVITKYEPPQAP